MGENEARQISCQRRRGIAAAVPRRTQLGPAGSTRPEAVYRSQKIKWPVCEGGFNRPLGPDQSRFCPMRRLRETPGWAPDGRFSMAARQFPISTAFSAATTV